MLAFAAAFVLLLTGCGAGPAASAAPHTPRSTPDPAAPAWAARGVDAVPPPGVAAQAGTLETIMWGGQVSGMSSEAVRSAAGALLRTVGWAGWAVPADQPALLTALSAPGQDPFHGLRQLLADARSHHGTVTLGAPLRVTQAFAFPVAPADADRLGGAAAVWRLTLQGPVTVSASWSGGGAESVDLGDGDAIQWAVTGDVVDDPLLGPVMRLATLLDCGGAGRVLAVCAGA